MSGIDFFIKGECKPQPRPKADLRRFGEKMRPHIYTPSTASDWKRAVRRTAREAYPTTVCVGPLRLCLRFVIARPEYHFDRGGLKASAPLHHDKENMDVDNLTKAVMDALTPMRKKNPTPAQAWGLWKGDGQVCQLYAEKVYADPGEPCGCRVMVTRCIEEHAQDGLFVEAGA
jgi:Holliday junction resolvase RusA-like endonuclease